MWGLRLRGPCQVIAVRTAIAVLPVGPVAIEMYPFLGDHHVRTVPAADAGGPIQRRFPSKRGMNRIATRGRDSRPDSAPLDPVGRIDFDDVCPVPGRPDPNIRGVTWVLASG